MANNWTETIERYLREGRTVSGGCGASSGLKAVTNAAKTIASDAAGEAKQVFGAASTVFNNLIGSIQRVVTGGPSQQGYSAGELNSMNAAAIQNGAALARNVEGATGSQVAAIGGGNAVTPSGMTQAETTSAKIAAAEQTATSLNQITQADWAQGNKNYEEAVGQEMQLPNVFNPATSSENAAVGANAEALKAQQAEDTANNWWQPMVTAAIGGASAALTGGATAAIGAGMSAAKSFSGGSVGGVSDPGLATPSYMPGGGPTIAAPDMTGQYGSPAMPNI